MRVKMVVISVSLAAALSPPALAQSAVELYRRVVPLESSSGLVTIRESVARQLDVPERCDDGWMHCSVERRFAHIYRVDFDIETRRQTGDELFVEREARGTLHLALAATREDEEIYDELLRESLSGLGAAAFDRPFAGLRPGRDPFGRKVVAKPNEPSWSCFDNSGSRAATEYKLFVDVRGDGTELSSTGLSTYDGDEVTEPLCAELERATAGAHPEELRTMSTPRLLLEETLTVEVADMLLAEAYIDELVELPEGAEMSRKETPGVGSMNRRQVDDGVINVARTRDGVEIAARMTPAKLPPPAATVNAWHSRWRLQTVEGRLGPLPENRLIESWSLTASLLPTLPPRDLDQAAEIADDRAYVVSLDGDLLFAGIAKAIDFSAELSPVILAERISNNIGGLGPSGWILVICLEDGSASWGLPQAGASAELLNDALFCSAIETYLP